MPSWWKRIWQEAWRPSDEKIDDAHEMLRRLAYLAMPDNLANTAACNAIMEMEDRIRGGMYPDPKLPRDPNKPRSLNPAEIGALETHWDGVAALHRKLVVAAFAIPRDIDEEHAESEKGFK